MTKKKGKVKQAIKKFVKKNTTKKALKKHGLKLAGSIVKGAMNKASKKR